MGEISPFSNLNPNSPVDATASHFHHNFRSQRREQNVETENFDLDSMSQDEMVIEMPNEIQIENRNSINNELIL